MLHARMMVSAVSGLEHEYPTFMQIAEFACTTRISAFTNHPSLSSVECIWHLGVYYTMQARLIHNFRTFPKLEVAGP